LILALGGTAPQQASQREFDLLPGVTVIGSGPDADLRLDGLDAHHAEIRRDDRDEYIYVDLGSGVPVRVDGQEVSSKSLRTSDRIELGDWALSYFREELPIMAFPSEDGRVATRTRFSMSRVREVPPPREAGTGRAMIPASISSCARPGPAGPAASSGTPAGMIAPRTAVSDGRAT
jgi:pSer/pThr/pTyr-binding forkhead associated (FHA) protein